MYICICIYICGSAEAKHRSLKVYIELLLHYIEC